MYSSARGASRAGSRFRSSIGKVSSAGIPWSRLNVTGAGGSGKNSGGPLWARSEYSDAWSTRSLLLWGRFEQAFGSRPIACLVSTLAQRRAGCQAAISQENPGRQSTGRVQASQAGDGKGRGPGGHGGGERRTARDAAISEETGAG